MPELIVLCRELRYAGKSYLKGSRFEASDKDAKVLKAIGKADHAPAHKPVRKVAETKPRVVVDESLDIPEPPAVEPQDEAEAFARRSVYRTRRLKADD